MRQRSLSPNWTNRMPKPGTRKPIRETKKLSFLIVAAKSFVRKILPVSHAFSIFYADLLLSPSPTPMNPRSYLGATKKIVVGPPVSRIPFSCQGGSWQCCQGLKPGSYFDALRGAEAALRHGWAWERPDTPGPLDSRGRLSPLGLDLILLKPGRTNASVPT